MDARRRLVGFALFASAALIGVAAALILTGALGFDDESRQTTGLLVGAVALLDAVLGVYFVMSSSA